MRKKKMQDPWNPTASEIAEWAYEKKGNEPEQDWMLVLSWKREEKLYLDLAADADCPKRRYFLDLLYFIVGDAVRSKFQTTERPIIEGFLKRAKAYAHPEVQKWVQRSEELLAHPDQFHYGLWCEGKLAKR